jgi:hypothetical protein
VRSDGDREVGQEGEAREDGQRERRTAAATPRTARSSRAHR